ncbi:unnamed protein product [Brassica napus]|uniref:(rape) hypothetical protein n=1 Tax=Brassica napus TaxID=3708 RepID=A0A816YIN9_BRANA|nr:unnamed protein product [Brassica napus]
MKMWLLGGFVPGVGYWFLVRCWCVCLMLFGVVLAFHLEQEVQVSFGCFVLFAAYSFG